MDLINILIEKAYIKSYLTELILLKLTQRDKTVK